MKNLAIIFAFFYCNLVMSSVIHIPADYLTIQEGINSANSGDTVLVSPGIYFESISLSIDNLTLASYFLTTGDTSYIPQTIIDGNKSTVIKILAPTTEAVSIIGFTIQNGVDGISAYSKFTLLNNRITNCGDGIDYESGSGGLCKNNVFIKNRDDGIDLDGAVDILIEDNIIAYNNDDGIEIRLHPYSGENLNYIIRRNKIFGNKEDGIQLIDYPDVSNRTFLIERNLIYNNAMVGIGCMSNGNTTENYEGAPIPEIIYLFNNTIDNNNYGITGGFNLVSLNNIISNSQNIALKNVNGNSIVAYSCVFGNTIDTLNCNIDVSTIVFNDPRFNTHYELLGGSPCIDNGTPFLIWESSTVLNLSDNEYFGFNPDIGGIESSFVNATHLEVSEFDCRIFPNPNNGFFNLNLNDNTEYITIEIFNINGQNILSSKLKNKKTQIDLSSYSKGLYFVKLTRGNFYLVKRIIIN